MKKKILVLSMIILTCLITTIMFKKYSNIATGNNNMIAIFVDDKQVNTIPSKNSGYVLEKYECTDKTKIRWNYETWSLLLKDFKKGTKCNYYFKKGYPVEIDNQLDEGSEKEGQNIDKDEIGIVEGTKVKDLEKPTKEGYTFEGWYDENGNALSEDAIIKEDMHIIAKWTINTYKLTIKTNGGTINDSTNDIVVNLKYKEQYAIKTISKKGYTLEDLETDNKTTTTKDNVITMGSDDTIINVKWKINSYWLKIKYNCNNQEETKTIKYHESIDLLEPKCSGYTYAGYDLDHGTYENNQYTSTDSNATLSFKWTANKYPYIVRHHKQNVNGEGYTLVSSDTLESTATYNTKITPDIKTYAGFTSPSKQTMTIKVDDKTYQYNKVDYNYARNKYTLTINTNGGTSSGNKTRELYYEQTSVIEVPTKTCSTFVNWTATSGTITDNIFKMGTSNATITANYQPIKYTLTYNVNGGDALSVNTKSINCGETIGTLPTPTKTNSKFEGWYTEQSGGQKVTSDMVINKNTIIYAHWTSLEYTIVFDYTEANQSLTGNQMLVYGKSEKLSKHKYAKKDYSGLSIYEFVGWALTKDGDVVYTDEQEVINLAKPGESKTLYAKYKAIRTYFEWENQSIDPTINKIDCHVSDSEHRLYKEYWHTERTNKSEEWTILEVAEDDEDYLEYIGSIIVDWSTNTFINEVDGKNVKCTGYSN